VDAEQREQLRLRWQQTIEDCGGRADLAREMFDDLARGYAEPCREYHTLDHIRQVLDTGFTIAPVLPPALILAIILHDVIYDTHAGDNEERSAEYAQAVLEQLGVSPEVREETARLILLTKTHQTTAGDEPGQILLDADLAILGADEPAYNDYAAAIRREYAWVSDPDYRTGRRRVLERFLARPRLYFTEAMFRRCDTRARANLAREISRLGG
jgi:predicted metal-dependent HD superfamily phosphohydrolase